jgi:hypothetical protein
VVSADGSSAAVVPTTDAGAIYPSFLPNGRLMYAALTPAGRKQLTSVAPDGTVNPRLPRFAESFEKGMQSFGNSPQVMDNINQLYAYLKGRSDGAITRAKVEEIQ